jgi:hypothetical protein
VTTQRRTPIVLRGTDTPRVRGHSERQVEAAPFFLSFHVNFE